MRYIASLALILYSSILYSSPQMPDYVVYKNDTFKTYNLILEQYLQKKDTAELENLFGFDFRNGSSFSCWRGYQAIYKIENDSLFLTDIINCGELRSKIIDKKASNEKMKSIFGNKSNIGKIYINWFSGDFSFPLNNNLIRWDGIFYKIYEKETVISIDNGRLMKTENVNNYAKKAKAINRKNKEKLSSIFFKKLKKVNWKNIKKFDCSEKYLITINEEGRVSKVTMIGYDTDDKIDTSWDREEYNYCVETIYNALSKLDFDIIKSKGKPISEDIYIYIWFDTPNSKIENWTDSN
jgi:hypothetical protein